MLGEVIFLQTPNTITITIDTNFSESLLTVTDLGKLNESAKALEIWQAHIKSIVPAILLTPVMHSVVRLVHWFVVSIPGPAPAIP